MSRQKFKEYIRLPGAALEDLCPEISREVTRRIQLCDYIETRTELLLWAKERWPDYFKRSQTTASIRQEAISGEPGKKCRTLEGCMEILWADYLAWAERA